MPSDESISNLVIGQDELETIQALSNRQNSKIRHWSADFIEGKGSGQIILLHGISPLAHFVSDTPLTRFLPPSQVLRELARLIQSVRKS